MLLLVNSYLLAKENQLTNELSNKFKLVNSRS